MGSMDKATPSAHGFALKRLWSPREGRIAARAMDGDAAAFAAIFERHHQELYRYCRSIVRDSDDAEDALQSTMMSALRSLPGERREIVLRPWLFRVAHNHAISILRARRRELGLDRALADSRAPGCEADLEARARLRHLLADLERLTERQRAGLTMRELSGLSFEEIGHVLAIAPQAARQAVYEARIALREFEEGREMECDAVCELISAGDRRALRARRIRAHLSGCSLVPRVRRCDRSQAGAPGGPRATAGGGCGGRSAALDSRCRGGGDGAGAGAGGATAAAGVLGAGGKGIGAAAAAKAAGSIVAATAIGIGAADRAGLIETPLPGPENRGAAHVAPAGAGPSLRPVEPVSPPARETAGVGTSVAHSRPAPGRPARDRSGGGSDVGASNRAGGPPAHANAAAAQAPPSDLGAGGNPPAHSSAGGNPPAHSSAGGNPPAPLERRRQPARPLERRRQRLAGDGRGRDLGRPPNAAARRRGRGRWRFPIACQRWRRTAGAGSDGRPAAAK